MEEHLNNEDKLARLQEIEKICLSTTPYLGPHYVWCPISFENDFRWLISELREAWTHQRNDEEGIKVAVEKLRAELAEKEVQLRFAAGYISATETFRDKHPEDALDWIKKEAKWDRTKEEK
jgi:hypothetical protein